MKSKIALLVAILLGLLAALAVRQYVTQEKVAIFEGQKPVEIIVARRELQQGEAITGPSIELKRFPKEYLPPDSITWNDSAMIVGRKVSRLVKRGDAIQWSHLIEKEDQKETGLQSRLAIEERAFTISVSRISGVAGMIRPGDRIDLYGTFKSQGQQRDEGPAMVTYPILRNVHVLATDQDLSARDVVSKRRGSGEKESYSSLTLNVTPLEVSILIHANEMGTINAVLRNSSFPKDLTQPEKVTSENFWQMMDKAIQTRDRKLNKTEEGEEPETEEAKPD